MTDTNVTTELLPCPFCGSAADPEGWASIERKGPACTNFDCNGSADSVEAWNLRSPSLEPRAVEPLRVKPLVWIKITGDHFPTFKARKPFGSVYIIEGRDPAWFWNGQGYVSLEAAQAAAEVDYRAHILSTIEPSAIEPVGVSDRDLLDEILDEDAPNKWVWKTHQSQDEWLREKILPLLKRLRTALSSLPAPRAVEVGVK